MNPKSVFLSHNKADKPFARRLAADLTRSGADVWLDEQKIALGSSIQESIQEAIDSCAYLAVILTPESVKSKWVRQELKQALEREINTDKIVVLPLLLRTCELPGFLRDKKFGDFREEAQYVSTLNEIKSCLGLPLTETAQEIELHQALDRIAVHDLVNRLQYVVTAIEVSSIRHPELKLELSKVGEFVHEAADEVQRALQLRSFAGGTYGLRFSKTEITELVREVIRSNSSRFSFARHVKCDFKETGATWIMADEYLMRVAVNVVVENAFQASTEGQKVSVELTQVPSHVRISVSNQSEGVVDGFVEDLFRRGFHGHDPRQFPGKRGTGLWLAKLIVAAHGGELVYGYDIHAQEHTFCISLPQRN